MKKFFFVSFHNGSQPALAGASLFALLLLMAAACTSLHAPSLTAAAIPYNPVSIASGVPAKPGSLAWSPEGTHLAFIGKTLTVYDTEFGKQRYFPVYNPYYVVWAPGNTLYALSRDPKGNSVLYRVDMKNPGIKSTALAPDAVAVYPISGGKNLLVVFVSVRSLSYGTTIDCIVALSSADGDRSKTVYSFSKSYMMKNPDAAAFTAWTHAGPSPLDDALPVMEHVKPPVFPFRTKVNIVDLASDEASEMPNPGVQKIYLSASWSPDGKRMAMTDGDGHLEVRDRLGDSIVIDSSLIGIYPSWNPRGSRIYAGGYLIDSDGKNKEALLTNAAGSNSQWSPDGTKLAVATGDELLLFRNIRTSYIAPDKPLDSVLFQKLLLLKNLLSDGVISREEYNERHRNIITKTEDGK